MIDLSDIWSKAATPPDRRPIEEWAVENVTLPPVLQKRALDVQQSRHFIGPFRAVRSPTVRGVRILKPVRGGGTLIADVSIPWAVVNDSASILMILQDDKMADEHAELRTMPTLKSVPTIKPMMPSNRHQERKSDIVFANGLPLMLRGPALSNLQSKGFKWVILDEPWMYKPGTISQAKARMGDFVKVASNKLIEISQGGEEDSEWDLEYRSGVPFIWRPRCAKCSEFMPIEWTINKADGGMAGLRFDSIKNADDTYDKEACAKTARYVCPHCGHEHPDTAKTRSEWNDTGWYFNEKTGASFDVTNIPTEVSFRWHGLIDWPWSELVKLWLSAQEAKHVGNLAPLIAFFQKYCALMRSERSVHEGQLPFARFNANDSDTRTKFWADEIARFLTVDKQSDGLYWATVRAWGKGGETRRLWFGKLFSEADIEAKRIEFGVSPDCTVIDSGYEAKGVHGVYAACIRYGWVAAKGVGKVDGFYHSIPREVGPPERVLRAYAPTTYTDPGEGTGAQGGQRAPLIRYASDVLADRVHGLINTGHWVEPEADRTSEIEKEYAQQMTAEFSKVVIVKPEFKRRRIWVCPSGNNHAFDVAKLQVLCAMQTGLIPAGIELSTTENEQNEPAATA
jgi:hypothetical protein